MKKNTWIFYKEKLSVLREIMDILSVKKTRDFIDLPQNVPERSIENSRIVN